MRSGKPRRAEHGGAPCDGKGGSDEYGWGLTRGTGTIRGNVTIREEAMSSEVGEELLQCERRRKAGVEGRRGLQQGVSLTTAGLWRP